MQKRKNQHYVPQFYLRNFSRNIDEKTIGLFNPKNDLFVESTSIKNQSSKDFFYGKDGKIEKGLSEIENILAPRLTELISTKKLPNKNSDDHLSLLIFAILTDLRNPIHIDQIKNFSVLMNQQINEFGKVDKKSSNFVPDISHEFAVELSLENYESVLAVCLDLDFKLLLNETKRAFLTSDFPVVKYNQFLETKEIHGSRIGYSTLGLQIFLPLNPYMCMLFYDPTVYKVGNRKDKFIELNDSDVNQLNVLQLLNCSHNVYFNEDVDKLYVKELFQKSAKYKKANRTTASSHGVIKNDEIQENEQIIHIRSTDLLTKLLITGIKSTRRANNINLENGISPLRPKAKILDKKTTANNGNRCTTT